MRDQPTSQTPLLILIADDNVDTREMYALYLTTVGYRVRRRRTGTRPSSERARCTRTSS